MKPIKILNITIFVILVLLCGCVRNETEQKQAIKMSISQIKSSPDFYWFDQEYNNYKLDMQYIDSIKNFASEELEIIVFASPSCLCGTDYLLFPKLIKILDSSGINYNIYVMYDITNEHPYKKLFDIPALPSFALLINNEFMGIWDDSALSNYKSTEHGFLEVCKSIWSN